MNPPVVFISLVSLSSLGAALLLAVVGHLK